MSLIFSREDEAWILQSIPIWKQKIKRLIDIFGGLIALLLILPLLLILSLLIRISSKGPVFFRQERVGYLGVSFKIYKFRTMLDNADQLGGFETNEHDSRITPLGKFLRRWSLDELPQFWNVLIGEMSLVGPRPTLKYQVDAYTPTQMRRLLVKPGITGLAQVSGRNLIPWPQRIDLDLKYIEKYSLWLDFLIVSKTVTSIFSKKGIY